MYYFSLNDSLKQIFPYLEFYGQCPMPFNLCSRIQFGNILFPRFSFRVTNFAPGFRMENVEVF